MGGSTSTPEEIDGRRLRREQNREAVLEALAALYREGSYQPSSNDIAERAGISPRSLFRYFDDVDDLNRAAIERQLERARPLLDVGVPSDAPFATRVEALVEARLRLFDTIAPAARAGRASAHRHAVIAAQIHESRSFLRHQLTRLFAREFDGRGVALLPAVDALCSFETYDLMRGDQGLSGAKTTAALCAALHALLEPGDTT